MNPYQTGAKLLLRVMALGMIIVGGLNATLELLRERAQSGTHSLPQLILGTLGLLAGVILFLASAKIAARTRDYEARFANPFVAAERGFIDEVIMPHSSRKRIARAFAALAKKTAQHPARKHDTMPL